MFQREEFLISEASPGSDYLSIVKIVFLGSQGVGKTNLFTRLDNDNFKADSKPTIGVDFAFKQVRFKGQNYRL